MKFEDEKKCVRCIWVEGRWEVAIVYSWECDILGRPRVSPLCPSITAQYTAYIHYKLHTTNCTLHVEHCNIAMLGQTALFVFNHHWVHALQIGDYTDVEQIQSTLPFSQFKRTGHHSVQHNFDICTEVFCPVSILCTAVSITQFAQHCSNLIDQFPFNFQNWENGCLAPKQRISTVKIDS